MLRERVCFACAEGGLVAFARRVVGVTVEDDSPGLSSPEMLRRACNRMPHSPSTLRFCYAQASMGDKVVLPPPSDRRRGLPQPPRGLPYAHVAQRLGLGFRHPVGLSRNPHSHTFRHGAGSLLQSLRSQS